MQRVAYLVSQYPKLSHAFIAREIAGLRSLGVEVEAFSVRPAEPAELLTETDRAEYDRTTVILRRPYGALIQSNLVTIVVSTRAWLVGLWAAIAARPVGLRAKLWQVFYFAEAVHLVRLMRSRDLDHVHVHLANNAADVAMSAAVMTARSSRPITWSLAMHGPTEFFDVKAHRLAAKVRSAVFVACISDFCRSQLMTVVDPGEWDKLRIVRMGVDPDEFPALGAVRADRSAPLRVLFVGRLVPEKAPLLLIRAVAQQPEGSVALRIVGDGPEMPALRREVERLGADTVVELMGGRGLDEVRALYAWADVFCLPSFAEGVPVVLMEAMASELPVITTPVGGITELVDFGDSGLLVPPGNSARLGAAIGSLATSPQRRGELGAAGRRKIEAEFTVDANVNRLAGLLGAVQGSSDVRSGDEARSGRLE